MSATIKATCGIVAAVIVLHWVSWGFVGGYAVGGKVVAGHYYVNHKGRLVEVSQSAFEYSLWLDRARDAALMLGVLSGAALYSKERKAKQDRQAAALSRSNLN